MLFQHENDFDREFLSAAIASGVPVSSLKGIVAMESQFNPRAYREEAAIKDASYGLMQILFKTAQGVGYKGSTDGLFDPAVNLSWGSQFLARLVGRYPNYLDAVAAYNMGSPRLARDLKPGTGTYDTIVRIYGKPEPGWKYQNQPYVDRVAAFTAYYQAVERNDPATAAVVLDDIKKKVLPKAQGFFVLPSRELFQAEVDRESSRLDTASSSLPPSSPGPTTFGSGDKS